MLLNKFKLKNWKKLTPAKRQDVLQLLENKMAKRAKRPAMPVSAVIKENWTNYGMFEFSSNKATLHLNLSLLTNDELRFQAMATVLHEGRHCTQHYATNGKLSFFDFRAKRWQKNMQKYVRYSEDEELYKMQEIERDAQKFALKKLNAWKHKFRNEEDFWIVFNGLVGLYEQNEQDARVKYGMFYKNKIRRKIDRRM